MGGRHQAPSPQSFSQGIPRSTPFFSPPHPPQIFENWDASKFNSLRLDQDLPTASHLRADASGHLPTPCPKPENCPLAQTIPP